MARYACPQCGSLLTLTRTLEYDINPETGVVENEVVDNFINCPECSWDGPEDRSGVSHSIIDANLRERKF